MLKHYAGSLLMLTVRIASSLAINKLCAFFMGAAGITALAHLQNLISLVTLVPADGVGRGLVKYIRDEQLSLQAKKVFVWAGLLWHLLIWFICGLVFLFGRHAFFRVFPPYWSTVQWAMLLIITMLGQIVFLFGSAFLLAGQQLKLYIICQMAASGLLLASVIISFRDFFLPYTLAGYAVGQGISVLVIIYMLISKSKPAFYKNLIYGRFQEPWVNQAHRFIKAGMLLGKYSLMALSVAFFGKTVDFFVRQLAVIEFGIQATGIWQSVVRLSELYTQVFTAILGLVYFPQLSSFIHTKHLANNYLKQTLRIWVPCMMAGLLLVYVSKTQLLTVLYNKQLSGGAVFLNWQLPADFFNMLSYFFAYVLLAKAQIGLFIGVQALSAGMYLASIYLLPHTAGIEILPMAYFIRSLGYCICVYVLTRR